MYLFLKLLHVLSVVLFLGNIITGLYWHAQAAKTHDAAILAHTMQGIIRSDRIFTIPGVVGIIVTGILMALEVDLPLLRTFWIGWSLILFAVSGIAFGWMVAPLQRELQQVAADGAESGHFDFSGYMAIARRWELWGAIALVTPLAALVLMVLKPT